MAPRGWTAANCECVDAFREPLLTGPAADHPDAARPTWPRGGGKPSRWRTLVIHIGLRSGT